MAPTTARIVAGVVALVTAAVLSSCGSSSSNDPARQAKHEDTPLITEKPAGYNADDIAFATNMIPHHEQALELSALVPDRSANPQVIKLAADISAAQTPEIETMKVFLVQWKENPDTGSGHGGHGAMSMQGMVDEPTMAKVESLKGTEFDTLWLQSMIDHHQGAIEMAKAEIANGDNVDAVAMAKRIVSTQQAEIDQMKQMLGG